jgi:hypothetical protein
MIEKLIKAALEVVTESSCPVTRFTNRVTAKLSEPCGKVMLTSLSKRLRKLDYIRIVNGTYTITDTGKAALNNGTAVRGAITSKLEGTYLCPELGRTCHRPNAYDFLDVPSRYNDERRVYRFTSGI